MINKKRVQSQLINVDYAKKQLKVLSQKMVINGQELLLSGNWYWDMYTGVTTEFSITFRNWTAPYIYEWSILMVIEESTVIPEFPSIPIIVMVLFTVVTATVGLRKLKRCHLKY